MSTSVFVNGMGYRYPPVGRSAEPPRSLRRQFCMIAKKTAKVTNGPIARFAATKSRASGFQSEVPDRPPHPSFCSAKYSQNDGITAIVSTQTKANTSENTTAAVQVHS